MKPNRQYLGVWLVSAAAFTCSWAVDVVLFVGTPLFAAFSFLALIVALVTSISAGKIYKPLAIDAIILSFMFWIIISSIWSEDLQASFRLIYYYFLSFLLFYLIRYFAVTKNDWNKIALSFIFGAFLAGLILVSKAFTGELYIQNRGSVGHINSNYLGYSIATAIPLLIAIAIGSKREKLASLLNFLVIFILISGIIVTGSRSALFAAISGLGVFVIYKLRKNIFTTALGLGGLIFFMGVFFNILPEDLVNRIDLVEFFHSGGQNVNANLSGRHDVWPIAIQYFKDNIIGGIGIGAFPANNPYGIGAHNLILSLAAETGIVGVFLYTAIVLSIFNQSILTTKNSSARISAMALFAVWLSVAMSGFWDTSPVAWSAFALVIILGKNQFLK